MKKLTEKEKRFVEAFVGKCAGNATQSVVEAGYGGNRSSAATTAWRLLRKAHIQKALTTRLQAREEKGLMATVERDQICAEIARSKRADDFARLRALDILNKCDARYSLKLIHSGRLTIEEALDQANAKLAGK